MIDIIIKNFCMTDNRPSVSLPDDFDYKLLSGDDSRYLTKVKFSRDVADSPIEKPRKCTDLFCCLFFTIAFAVSLAGAIYGFVAGDPWKLIAPIDGDGRICGYSSVDGVDMSNYKYLFIGDINEALSPDKATQRNLFDYGVCVKECPTEKNPSIECIGTEKVPNCANASYSYFTYSLLSYCIPVEESLPEELRP